MKIMKIFKGRVFYKIEKAPWYTTGVNDELKDKGFQKNVCLKYWKLPFSDFYLAKRQYVIDVSDELRDAITEAAKAFFKTENVEVIFESTTRYTIKNKDNGVVITYFEETYKFFCQLKGVRFTKDWMVLFSEKEQKYYGYSHRASQGFGIGDMLFCKDSEVLTEKVILNNYYKDKKYRKKFLKVLMRYHKRNDYFSFADMIKYGIMDIVPFKEIGAKKIENLDEAFMAAKAFAKYVS